MGLLSFKPFRKIPTTDRDMNLLQSHIADSLGSLNTTPHVLIGLQLQTGANLVSHGLGRNYVSWWAGNYDTSVALRPLKGPANNPDPSKFVAIQAAGPVVVDLAVY